MVRDYSLFSQILDKLNTSPMIPKEDKKRSSASMNKLSACCRQGKENIVSYFKILRHLGILLFYLILLTGCMPGTIATLVTGPPENYTETDSLLLDSLPEKPDILDICAEVGKSMGLKAQRFSRNTLMLLSHSQIGLEAEIAFRQALIGTAGVNVYSISISFIDSEKRLNIMTMVAATKNSREKAESITKEFKEKLLERLKTSIKHDTEN